MYAQLLFVALALFAVANAADTCTCSGCKGVTSKDCKVFVSKSRSMVPHDE